MILLADCEGPDQLADLGNRCPHMPEDKFSHDGPILWVNMGVHITQTCCSYDFNVVFLLDSRFFTQIIFQLCHHAFAAGPGGSVGCTVRLEIRRSRVQPPPRSATSFRGD